MVNAKTIAGITLVAAAAIAVSVARAPTDRDALAPDEPRRARALGCRLSVGARGAFRLESTAFAWVDGTRTEADRIVGTLQWKVVEEEARGQWRLQAQLMDVALTQRLSRPEERLRQRIDAPFFVRIGSDCRFSGFGFDPDWSARARQFVASLLLTFEFAVDAGKDHERWSTTQRDGLGTYSATYRLSGLDDAVLRTKTAYAEHDLAEMVGVTVHVHDAHARGEWAPGGQWLTLVEGRERIQIRIRGRVQADLHSSFSLVRNDALYTELASTLERPDWRDAFAMTVDGRSEPERAPKGATYEDYFDRFAALLAGGDASKTLEAAELLAAYLRTRPAAATRIERGIRLGDLAPHLRPAAFLALELSGTPEAKRVLIDLLRDAQIEALDRSRAALALADIGTPSPTTVEELHRAAREDADDTVSNVSLLALGMLGGRSESKHPDVRGAVQRILEDELDRAHGVVGREAAVLDAIGNSGDELFADAVGARLVHGDPVIRAHAAEAFRRMDPSVATPALVAHLRNEDNDRVSVAIAESLSGLGPPDAGAVDAVRARLATTTSKALKVRLIEWLGRATDTPAVADLLRAQFHRESDVAIKQLIGTFLPASQLL